MLKNTVIICALVAASAFANPCADFVVVNIATNDTTLHFSQKGTVLCTECHHEWHHRFKPPVFLRAHVVNRAGKLYVLLDTVNRVVWIISDIVDNMALWDEFTAYTKAQENRLNWGTMASICIMDAKWVGGRWIITDPLLAGYEHPGYGHDGYVARDIMDFGPKYANDKILVAEVISIIHEFERIYGMGLMGQQRRA